MKAPFIFVDWHENLLKTLVRSFKEEGHTNNLADILCIFPHSRPARYIEHMLIQDRQFARPLLLPQFSTINALFSQLHKSISQHPARNASMLDRVGILLECFRTIPSLAELLKKNNSYSFFSSLEPSSSHISPSATDNKDIEAKFFFPWGIKLASLFEECFSHCASPLNFMHIEGQVSPFAEKLLANLGDIFQAYCHQIMTRNWTTPGFDAYTVANYIQAGHSLPAYAVKAKQINVAGFFVLTKTENILFKHLWQQYNTTFFWQTDTSPVPHWSTSPIQALQKQWGAQDRTIENTKKHSPPVIRYVAGFDLHSQLQAMNDALAVYGNSTVSQEYCSEDFAAETAIVLPESSVLMPVLHSVPHTEVNISMGYPLSRSPLFRLIDTIFSLQERKRHDSYYWKDLIDLVRHPYVKMLRPEIAITDISDGEPKETRTTEPATPDLQLRRELHAFEKALRSDALAFSKPREILETMYLTVQPEELPDKSVIQLIDTLFDTVITRFSSLQTTRELALALDSLCTLLYANGRHLFKRFPIDGECLFRVIKSLIPELMNSVLADEKFPPATLFEIARQIINAERVPFDADPLVGMQLLGMLETRLLSFKNLLIPDCTEDVIPGISEGDPLLPDVLRTELGLPGVHTRETVAAYHFFRLINGSENVTLLWQEGESSGLQDSKKRRSRFIESLLWDEEKKIHRLLKNKGSDGPLTTIASKVASIEQENYAIQVTPEIKKLVLKRLEKPVSATFLDKYLMCPAKFYYEELLSLKQPDDVEESSSPLAIGEILHATLQEFYEPRINISIDHVANCQSYYEELLAIFHSQREYRRLASTIPADAFTMFSCSGHVRLHEYLINQPETTVLALEHTFRTSITFASTKLPISFTGRADRIDLRDGQLHIVDYKTGKIPQHSDTFWENELVWKRIDDFDFCALPDAPLNDPLPLVAKELESVQLPLYLLLARNDEDLCKEIKVVAPIQDAVWVELAKSGQEISLFSKKLSTDFKEDIISNKFVKLFDFILSHMIHTPQFSPRKKEHCRWCSFRSRCRVQTCKSKRMR